MSFDPADMGIDPAKLAQMDREKTTFDRKLDELIEVHRSFQRQVTDPTVAYFNLMEAMANVDAWKLMATLAAAVDRLAREELPDA